jgi:ribosomal protein S18 acetylase RimI-like enzyme
MSRYALRMHDSGLDNPFWSSLRTRHASIALGDGDVLRYPAEYAPFLGIAHEDVSAEALAALIAPGESVYLIGLAPRVAAGFRLRADRPLAQMIREKPVEMRDDDAQGDGAGDDPKRGIPEIVPLDARHRDDVLALTALVYPHYFRPRTMAMGAYYGIYREGRLAAMIGERLGTDDVTEMSAICTHPDFNGLGYARRLTAMLTNRTLAAGRLPFLHVSAQNVRAKQLYERMGYRLRAEVGFWSLSRELR